MLVIDTETTGLGRDARIFAYSVTDWEGKTEIYRSLDRRFLPRLKELFKLGKNQIPLIFHNASFDLGMISRLLGRPVWRGLKFHDTMVLSHLVLNHHYSHSLEDLAFDLAGYPKIDREIHGLAKKLGGMHKVPKEDMDRYQTADGERTMLLFRAFFPKVRGRPEWARLYELELEVIQVSLDMERRGIRLLRGETGRLIEELERKCRALEILLEERTWKGFQPLSVLDRRKLLYEVYGFKPIGKKTGTGEETTNKVVIRQYLEKRGVPDWRKRTLECLLEYGSYRHGIPILKGYLKAAGEDGIIHPRIHSLAAVTGRQSASNPNLMNVAKEEVLLNPYPIPARRCFGPREGYVNLHIDYSGIEMRLLVHYSKDERMLEAFRKGEDPHDLACQIFYGQLTKELRGAAKNTNFAIPYGAQIQKVYETLGLGKKEGEQAFLRYQSTFPGLCGLSRVTAEEVFNTGGVTTAHGRYLRVPKREAYVGTNYKIQGTGADILKIAETRVARLHRGEWDGVYLLLPIHDELVIEYPASEMNSLPDYLADVERVMTDFPQLTVPLEIGVEIAVDNWSEKTEWNPRTVSNEKQG
jgi:DNA polymerase-1